MHEPTSSSPLLEVRDLWVSYGGVVAVAGISFQVEEGEVVAIIGANGAGKSSTLMALSGLAPTQGEILYRGERIHLLPPADRVRRGVIQIPEGRRIFPHLTVEENLNMGGFLVRDSALKGETMRQVYDLFPILKERKSQLAGSLSGGEQQMLAIGRALMGQPKLLLMDEPSLGLSPILTARIFMVIEELARGGRSILLVEQNARAALKVSQRAYVLETGRIVGQGPSSALAQDPLIRRAYLGLEG